MLHTTASSVDLYGRGDAFCSATTKPGPFPFSQRDKNMPWVWDATVLIANSGGHRVQVTILPWTACQFSVPEWRSFTKLVRKEAVYLEQLGNGSLNSSLTPIYDIAIFNTTERQGQQKLHKATQLAEFTGEKFHCIFADKKSVVIGRSTTDEVTGEFLSLGAISVVCLVPEQAILFHSMRLERTIDGKLLQTPPFSVCRLSDYKSFYSSEKMRLTSNSTSGYPRHYPHHRNASSSSTKEQQQQSSSNRLDAATKPAPVANTTLLHPFFNLTVCTGVGKGNLRTTVVEWVEYHQVTYLPTPPLTHPLTHHLAPHTPYLSHTPTLPHLQRTSNAQHPL